MLCIDKPVIYQIISHGDKVNYVGLAHRSLLPETLKEHFLGAQKPVPGQRVVIYTAETFNEAYNEAVRLVKLLRPPYNHVPDQSE